MSVNAELNEYKRLIDDLVVTHKEDVTGFQIRTGKPVSLGYPENNRYNQMLARLSSEDRELLAEMLDHARSGGVHDTLVLLDEGKYRLWRGELELPFQPYGSQMFFDFVARREGDPWPDELST